MTRVSRAVSAGSGLLLMAAVAIGTSACGPSDGASSGTSAPSSPAAGSTAPSTASSSAPAAGGTVDVAKLVIKAGDIPIPGFTQTASTPVSQSGANGVAVSFANADGSRQVGDTIVTLPDTGAAKTALDAAMNAAKGQIEGVKSAPVQIGDGGYLLSGTESGKSATILIFQQGTAFVVMEFASAAGDPVPEEVVNQVGQKQAELLKAGLPG
jgi:hypothetical protein